jgi:D-Tyr-tRNAtyr deacylase
VLVSAAARASRSTPCASSATARPGGWASRSPRRRAGAAREVVLLAANLAVAAPAGVESIATPTAERCSTQASRSRDVDLVLHGRRRADYRPPSARGEAREGRRRWTVELEPTPTSRARSASEADGPGARRLRRRARRGGLERKRAMLDDKNADLVVYNDVGRADIGFDAAENEVVLVTRAGERSGREGVQGDDCRGRFSTRPRRCCERRLRALFRRAGAASAQGMTAQATVPLEKAKRLEPAKASIREGARDRVLPPAALGQAEAGRSSGRCSSLSPTDHYAHYALGRALEKQGRADEANGPTSSRARWPPASRRYAARIRGGGDVAERPRGLADAVASIVAPTPVGLVRDIAGRMRASCNGGAGVATPGGAIADVCASSLGWPTATTEAAAARLAAKIARPARVRGRRRQVRPVAPPDGRAALVRVAVHAARRHAKGNRQRFAARHAGARGTAATSASAPSCARRGTVEQGVFGARMTLELVNVGPVTVVLEAPSAAPVEGLPVAARRSQAIGHPLRHLGRRGRV